jgi:hypothetical protein
MAATAATMAGLAALALAGCSRNEKAADEATASGGGSVTSTIEAPGDMPRPIPGKWKITSTQAGLPRPIVIETCFTPEMVSGDAWATGQRPPDFKCSEESHRRDGAAVVAHSVCEFMGATHTTDIRFEGDFRKRYTMEMTSTTQPAPPGMTNPSKTSAVVERVGDC